MPDETPQSWSMDPSALIELRLLKARGALEANDTSLAIVEAEELLDDVPDQPDALLIIGEASLEARDASLAHAAYERYLELQPDDPDALSGFAIASFELTLLDACIEAGARAVELAPDLAEGWYFMGLALERSERLDEALVAFVNANQLAPEVYPLVPASDDAHWEASVREAFAMLHPRLTEWYAGVKISVERFPALADLRVAHPPLPPTASALYLGDPPEVGEGWALRPAAVRLYRGNLERLAAIEGALPRRIAEAMHHEAVDWLGLEPDAFPLVD